MKGSHLKAKRKDIRSRGWSFLLYPESMPNNWDSELDKLCCPVAVSPLHNKDIYEDETESHKVGEVKKPHYHAVICFDGKKSLEQVKELLAVFNCPLPQVCHNIVGSVRYFTHIDNPNKAQYDKNLIKSYCGFNVDKCFALRKEDYSRILCEIYKFIKECKVKSFSDLVDGLACTHPEYLVVLGKYSYFVNSYLNSLKAGR
jgi:hypothetical protein